MATNPTESGTLPPELTEPESNSGSGRSGKRRNGNWKGTGGKKEAPFTGKSDQLKHLVYDVVTGKETFLKTTREIAEYVSREYDDTEEF